MKLTYDKHTNELIGLVSEANQDPTPDIGFTTIPTGFKAKEMILWRFYPAELRAKLKEGQEMEDAVRILKGGVVHRLILTYFGEQFNPRNLGQLEGAVDVVVQMVNKWLHDEKPTPEELSAWDHWYEACGPYFKVTLRGLPDEIGDMTASKKDARDTEKAMKEDPEWPTI